MDLNSVVARAKGILISPKTEWPIIAERPDTVKNLYWNYIFFLAAIPAVFGFLKATVIGVTTSSAGTVRVGLVAGLVGMVARYVLSLGAVYVLALIVDLSAPSFGGKKSLVQAFKTVGYASTAAAIGSAGVIVPRFGLLLVLAGGAYTLYLLYLGLPVMMNAAPAKAIRYTAVVFVTSIVLGIAVGGAGGMLGTRYSAGTSGSVFSAFPVPQPQSGSFSAQAFADQVSSENVTSANNFSPAWGIQCSPGGSEDHFAIVCNALMNDAERSAQTANLGFLIYNGEADFSAEDALLADAVQRMPGRWKIDDQPEVSIDGPGGTVRLKTKCHQALGESNNVAACILQADPHVLILAQVGPAEPSTDSISGDPSSDTYQDIRRATILATMGAIHVAKSR